MPSNARTTSRTERLVMSTFKTEETFGDDNHIVPSSGTSVLILGVQGVKDINISVQAIKFNPGGPPDPGFYQMLTFTQVAISGRL